MPLAQFLSTKKSIGNEELRLNQDRHRGRTTKDIPRLNQLTPDLYYLETSNRHNMNSTTSNGSTFIVKEPKNLAFKNEPTKFGKIREDSEKSVSEEEVQEPSKRKQFNILKQSFDLRSIQSRQMQRISLTSLKQFRKSYDKTANLYELSSKCVIGKQRFNESLNKSKDGEVEFFQPDVQLISSNRKLR